MNTPATLSSRHGGWKPVFTRLQSWNNEDYKRDLQLLSPPESTKSEQDVLLPTRSTPYRSVKVLMIDWEDCTEKEFEQQRKKLAGEFRKYNFALEHFPIGSSRPHQTLAQRLQKFLAYDDNEVLLVIYYGGHGLNNKDKHHIWLCHHPKQVKYDRNPKVNWTALQSLFLDDCSSHVLFLLDTCYSAAAVQYTHASSTVEAIVAAGFEQVAPLRGRDSLTMSLVSVLAELRAEGKTAYASAVCRMVTSRLNRTETASAGESMRVTPHHIQFSNKLESIIIGVADAPRAAMENEELITLQETPQDNVERSPDRYEASDGKRGGTISTNDDTNIVNEPETAVDIAPPRPAFGRSSSTFVEVLKNDLLSEHIQWKPPYAAIRRSQIRTLHILLSERPDEPIIAHLVVEDLPRGPGSKQFPEYKAVSWVWPQGQTPEQSTTAINIIDDQLKNRYPIYAPSALITALRHIRDRQEKVVVWVDYICICQDADAAEERSHQASLMPTIFQNASEVIVWLGDEDEHSRAAMEFIPRLLDLKEFDFLVSSDDTANQWEGLVKLMRRPWFSRRWAFQEIILAKKGVVYCGSLRVLWTEFCDAVVLLGARFEEVQYRLKRYQISHGSQEVDKLYNSVRHTFGNLVDLRALGAYSIVEAARSLFRRKEDGVLLSSCDLETLVSSLPALQSSAPHDVIYALFGIANDVLEASDLEVDYSRDAAEIYQRYVRHCVRRSGSLDIICRPWAPLQRETGDSHWWKHGRVPSWICQVQNLPFGEKRRNIYGRKNGDVLVGHPNRSHYNAARGSTAFPVFGEAVSDDGKVTLDGSMTVSGFVIGTVEELGPRAGGGTVNMEWIELCGWDEKDGFIPDHLWRTLVADRGPEGTPTPSWYHRACQYWLDYCGGDDISYDVIQRDQHPSAALEYIRRVQSVIWDRALFRTVFERGRQLYGLSPRRTSRQDKICILHGCSVPVVLRQQKGFWELIGECFVYGMMDGDAMQVRAFTDKTQEFLIR